jgi:hypothetical protein
MLRLVLEDDNQTPKQSPGTGVPMTGVEIPADGTVGSVSNVADAGPTIVEIPTDSNGWGSQIVELVAQDITEISADDGSNVEFDVDSPSTTLVIVHSFTTKDGTVTVTVTT